MLSAKEITIFTADTEHLKSMLKNDIDRAQKEKWATWSLRKGLSQLTDSLEEVITTQGGVEIRKSTPCKKLEFGEDGIKVSLYTI